MSKKNTFLKGAAILGMAGILVKILGAFYRIPLANMIGDEGMGYYQTSYPLYNLLFAISTAGFPVAIAKLVSEKRAIGNYKGAHRVFKISFLGLVIGGILTSSVVFLGAETIVEKVGNKNAYYSMIALGPALLFVPIMSAFRGYFQGRQYMTPTALSQVMEQIFRVIIGLFLAYQLLNRGLPLAAGGASFGASAGAIAGTITVGLIYFRRRSEIKREIRGGADFEVDSTGKIIKEILSIAIPITIGSSIVPLINTVDVAIVMRRLQAINYTEAQASALYGQLTGMAQTLINLPQIFSVALAMSLVPAISDAYARRSFGEVKNIAYSGIRITLLIGLPAALGLFVLATPIMELLYFNNDAATLISAGSILQILAFSLIFLTLVQSLTAILQGLGKPLIPVRNLALGALAKLILTYSLTGIPSINVKGAAISTVAAYLVATTANFIAVKKYTKTSLRFIDMFFKPVFSAGLMTLVVWVSYNYSSGIVGGKVATILSIGIGILVYGLTLLITGSITSSDFELLPGGSKISKILKSFGILRK